MKNQARMSRWMNLYGVSFLLGVCREGVIFQRAQL
jgi:hypothetical protein